MSGTPRDARLSDIYEWLRRNAPSVGPALGAVVLLPDMARFAGLVVCFGAVVLLALAFLAPGLRPERFAWDRAHARLVARHGLALGSAAVFYFVTASITADDPMPRRALSFVVAECAIVAWFVIRSGTGREMAARGGYLDLVRLRRAVVDAMDDLTPDGVSPRTTRPVVRPALLFILVVALGATGFQVVRPGTTRTSSGERPTATPSPSATTSPSRGPFRATPQADDVCKYNVFAKIVDDSTPPHVAEALWASYVGPGAPGALEVGCPDAGTRRIGAVFVTWLFVDERPHAAAVSDADGLAAIVYPTLLGEVRPFIENENLARIGHRHSTRSGDFQRIELTDGTCLLAIRAYLQRYVVLKPPMIAVVVADAVARRQVPTVTVTDKKRARTTYVLGFGPRKPRLTYVFDADVGAVVTEDGRAVTPGGDVQCPDMTPLERLARRGRPLPPEHTP